MKLIDFIRLIRKHLVLLFASPIILAAIVILLTFNTDYKYASETTLYTGIATGSSVEMEKSFNYFITNTAFDNLINVIKSRKTQQEVAIRLLSIHLMLDKPDPSYISEESFKELKQVTPAYIYSYVINKSDKQKNNPNPKLLNSPNDVYNDIDPIKIPDYIDRTNYEQTVANLSNLMESSDTNFVYDLLNFPNPHYSFKEISEIQVQRIANSDLVKIRYETDDPGICQQTIEILTNVCIRNYRDIKENRSDQVVKYFEDQLQQASAKLRKAEDKLLQFNKDNKIINYYEQSKAVAVVKEDLDVEYNKQKMKLAGYEAAIKRLEEKLGLQDQIQLKSNEVINLKSKLSEVNYKIASIEFPGKTNDNEGEDIKSLKAEAKKITEEIKKAVTDLYSYKNSKEGIPVNSILNEWIAHVLEAENVKAGISVLEDRIEEFQKQYSIYAPAGANIKRIEREISVSEQEFLEILHGLNLAKLKLQDNELSSNIKVVDKPFFPISPLPTKRKILVVLAAMMGFTIVLGLVIVTEYFDQTLRTLSFASKVLKLNSLGLIPKILLKVHKIPILSITSRLSEMIIQNIELFFAKNKIDHSIKTILFFSTQEMEGKSVIAGNIARQYVNSDKKVLFLNYNDSSNNQFVLDDENLKGEPLGEKNKVIKNKFSLINSLLGYPDNRIDFNSEFLADPSIYLPKSQYLEYQNRDDIVNKESLIGFIQNKIETEIPEYVIIEIPAILKNAYPADLISEIDLPVLVCRANRVWSEADQNALNTLQRLNSNSCMFILNGVELQAVEAMLGELPRKRSWVRRAVKKLVLFQFLSKNHL